MTTEATLADKKKFKLPKPDPNIVWLILTFFLLLSYHLAYSTKPENNWDLEEFWQVFLPYLFGWIGFVPLHIWNIYKSGSSDRTYDYGYFCLWVCVLAGTYLAQILKWGVVDLYLIITISIAAIGHYLTISFIRKKLFD